MGQDGHAMRWPLRRPPAARTAAGAAKPPVPVLLKFKAQCGHNSRGAGAGQDRGPAHRALPTLTESQVPQTSLSRRKTLSCCAAPFNDLRRRVWGHINRGEKKAEAVAPCSQLLNIQASSHRPARRLPRPPTPTLSAPLVAATHAGCVHALSSGAVTPAGCCCCARRRLLLARRLAGPVQVQLPFTAAHALSVVACGRGGREASSESCLMPCSRVRVCVACRPLCSGRAWQRPGPVPRSAGWMATAKAVRLSGISGEAAAPPTPKRQPRTHQGAGEGELHEGPRAERGGGDRPGVGCRVEAAAGRLQGHAGARWQGVVWAGVRWKPILSRVTTSSMP
jgi:hypothetical protein